MLSLNFQDPEELLVEQTNLRLMPPETPGATLCPGGVTHTYTHKHTETHHLTPQGD